MKYAITNINKVIERLEKVLERTEKGKIGKRERNMITWCKEKLELTAKLIEEDLKPKKPKMLKDAVAWIETQKKTGTWIALLTEEGHLVKTMYLTKNILDKLPEAKITVEPVELKMNKIMLVIPSLNFSKPIAKKVKAYTAIRKAETKAEVIK